MRWAYGNDRNACRIFAEINLIDRRSTVRARRTGDNIKPEPNNLEGLVFLRYSASV